MTLTHLDLFSGIGGFALAARWAGLRTIGFSEIEPYACQVLAKNFPGVPNLGDIRGIRGCRADVVTGGFPCQPFSVAGKRGGAGDDRHLWPEMRRVIAESGAAWVVGENVPGIIGMELDNVLADLEAMGYEGRAFTVPAVAVDAPHRRDRVWIVAHADRRGAHAKPERLSGRAGAADAERDGAVWTVADAERTERRAERGARGHLDGAERLAQREESAGGAGAGGEAVADAHGAGSQGRERGGVRQRAGQRAAGAGGASIPDAAGERGDGAGEAGAGGPGEAGGCHRGGGPAVWLSEPGVGRVADGIPRRVDRLRGLGNAIVPQVAFRFLRWIAEAEARGETELF